jgi:nitrous oxidase accessory protein NosD
MNSSDNNSIFKNNCSENDMGIFSVYANNNDVYLNNFMNNDVNAGSPESSNTWSSPSKITYTYNGKTYTNYLGNYWDDYSRSDNDNDGLGDASYRIDGIRDRYPLMEPWEKYF